jgi:2'-hydroxyisoflavone reductase
VFTANGPVPPITLGGLLTAIKETLGSDAHFTWADGQWLIDRGVQPWGDLPMWIPAPHLQDVDPGKAIRLGLRFRPLADTIRDAWEWERAATIERKAIAPEREAALLAEWRAR